MKEGSPIPYILSRLVTVSVDLLVKCPCCNNKIMIGFPKHIKAADAGKAKNKANSIALFCNIFAAVVSFDLMVLDISDRSTVPMLIPIIPRGSW